MSRSLVVGIFMVAVFVSRVGADPALDQSFESTLLADLSTSVTGRLPSPGAAKAQTFTVGISGSLSGIQMPIFRVRPFGLQPNAPLVVDIRPTNGGVPAEVTSLATLSVAPELIPESRQWVHFDFSPLGLQVAIGDVLAIVLRSETDEGYYAFGGSTRSTYVGGAFYDRRPTVVPTFTLFRADADLFFRTFVGDSSIPTGTIFPDPNFPPPPPPPPAPTPEPGTFVLLGMALALVIFKRGLTR